jgi:hypothetical protein
MKPETTSELEPDPVPVSLIGRKALVYLNKRVKDSFLILQSPGDFLLWEVGKN